MVILYAAINGHLDDVPVNEISSFEVDFNAFLDANHPEIGKAISAEKDINAETAEKLKSAIAEFKKGRRAQV